ncbi:hypothetical protein CC80DRAFT_564392 [Byssothecium circinans]|uniref:Uncharacterized protein n=1 Tax=Byssothecium circinans TaxID=147558 RepID=A0A6A5TUC7_9PLEO|nr:hypothetical protein CC80DRAFT_564392 [Byssothecium circinans]
MLSAPYEVRTTACRPEADRKGPLAVGHVNVWKPLGAWRISSYTGATLSSQEGTCSRERNGAAQEKEMHKSKTRGLAAAVRQNGVSAALPAPQPCRQAPDLSHTSRASQRMMQILDRRYWAGRPSGICINNTVLGAGGRSMDGEDVGFWTISETPIPVNTTVPETHL